MLEMFVNILNELELMELVCLHALVYECEY